MPGNVLQAVMPAAAADHQITPATLLDPVHVDLAANLAVELLAILP